MTNGAIFQIALLSAGVDRIWGGTTCPAQNAIRLKVPASHFVQFGIP